MSDIASTEDSPAGSSNTLDIQTASTEPSSTSGTSVGLTPTTSLASTDSSITLPSINAATSTVTLSSFFQFTGRSSSRATFSSSDTTPTPLSASSAASFTSDSPYGENASSLPPSSREPSQTRSADIIIPSLDTSTSLAEITSSTTVATSSSTETVSQTEAPSGSVTSAPSDSVSLDASTSSVETTSTSPPTMTLSETAPTSVSPGPNGRTTSQTASSNSSSISQTSSPSRTALAPSVSSSAASTSFYHHIHSHTSQDTGGDTTPTITSPDTGSTPTSFGQETHNDGSHNAGEQSQISATDANSESLQGIHTQGPPLRQLPQPSDVITLPQRSTRVQTATASSSSTLSDQEIHNNDSPNTGGQYPTSGALTDTNSGSSQSLQAKSTITSSYQRPTELQTATLVTTVSSSSTAFGKGDNDDGSSSGGQLSSQGSVSQTVTDPSTAIQTFGDNGSNNQGSPSVSQSTLTAPSSSFTSPSSGESGSAPVNGPNSIPESFLPPANNNDSSSSIFTLTPASTSQHGLASTSAGVINTTSNATGPTGQRGSIQTRVPHSLNTASHSATGQSEGNDGLIDPTYISVSPTTVSPHHTSSSAAAASDLSPSNPVRLRNPDDGGVSTYTTTFTSLKTFFELTTVTISPPPATITTSTPYRIETTVITTTIVVSTSKAGNAFRLSKAQIGGIVTGAVLFFALLVAILIYLIRRKRRRMDFVLVSPNDISSSDAEMGEDGDSHNIRRSPTQVLPEKANTSDSDFFVLPPSGQFGYDTPTISNSTFSGQHSSRRGTINSVYDLPTLYLRSYSVDTTNYSDEGHSIESDNPQKTHQGDVAFQPVLCKSPTIMSCSSDNSNYRYGYAI